MKNAGATPIAVKGLTVVAQPDNWTGPVAHFPVAGRFTLRPGEVRTYDACHAFSVAGTYFAEPRARIDGPWSTIEGGSGVTITLVKE